VVTGGGVGVQRAMVNARTCSICGEKLTTNVSAARRDVSVQTIFNHTMAANHTSDWEHCTAGVRSRS
jgi:hypothetical protein